LLLADPVSLRFALGAALVLMGVLIVNLQIMLKRRSGQYCGAFKN
jgi:drug/metabolite transporter (DMT)-like permease